jgi:hypothetical protein
MLEENELKPKLLEYKAIADKITTIAKPTSCLVDIVKRKYLFINVLYIRILINEKSLSISSFTHSFHHDKSI